MVRHSSQIFTSEEEATTRAGPLGSALYSYVWSLHLSLKNFFYDGHVWLCCSRHPSSPPMPFNSFSLLRIRLRAVFSVSICKCLYSISSLILFVCLSLELFCMFFLYSGKNWWKNFLWVVFTSRNHPFCCQSVHQWQHSQSHSFWELLFVFGATLLYLH